jgi:hypothetical protein
MVRFALGILIPLAVGLPFTLWLPSWLVRIAMAFLGGMVIVTAGLMAVGAAGLRFNAVTLAPVAVVWLLAAALAVRRSRGSIGPRPSWPSEWHWPAWTLLALTGLNVATAAASAVRAPISDTDVVVIWFPKAVLIAIGGFKALAQSVYPDYPPLWPLHIWLANGGGASLKLLPSVYLVATLLIVFGYVRAKVGPTLAAACTLAISAVPYIWLPYGVNDLMSEIPTMAFVTASTIMLAEYVDQPSAARAAITALAAIGAVWVRPEGFFHAFLIAAILVIAGWRLQRVRGILLPAGAILISYLAWRFVVRFIFHYTGGLQANPAALTPSVVASTLTDIARYAAANAGNPYLFGPALIATTCIALGMTRWRSFAIVWMVLIIDIAVGVATYAALPSTDVGEPLIWWLTTGFKRMLMHFTPLLYVAAVLAIGGLLEQFRASERTSSVVRGQWGKGVALPVAVVALASICIAVAAYAAYRVGGPKSYDLSEMGPSHVGGAAPDYSIPGAISLPTQQGADFQLIYYLQFAGRRNPPVDNISGTFSHFASTVEVQGPVSDRFTASADGHLIAEATATQDSGPAALDGQIPIGTRFLELDVVQLGPGSGTAAWTHPTLERASIWWATEALLLMSLGILVASGLVGAGVIRLHPLVNTALVAIALLAAGAVQVAEAMWEVATPVWAAAAELVLRHL